MQRLTMIVHAALQTELADCLRSISELKVFIFTHVEEHSSQLENDELLSARDKVVGYVPQVRVDILLNTGTADEVLEKIRQGNCPFRGKGLYWISDVVEVDSL